MKQTYFQILLFQKRKRKQYPGDTLKEAVFAVRQGTSVRQASIKYNVPRRTIGNHVNGKVAEDSKPGPKTELSAEEEEALVEYIKYMSNSCLPLRGNYIRATILVCFINQFCYVCIQHFI